MVALKFRTGGLNSLGVFTYEAICTVFCSDDIKLRMKKQGSSEVLQECINVELKFDYLCPNEGYIISVSNEEKRIL